MTKSNKLIYLDWAASASPNPSSIHSEGVKARAKLEEARRVVADILKARPKEIIFTSGGTESNNLAIQGLIYSKAAHKENIPHIITTNIEHPSVLETVKALNKRGLAEVSIVPVESNGIVDPRKIEQAIKKNTILVSVMYANNEIGTIQPIREIAKIIRHYKKHQGRENIFFHTDAVQATNYLDININQMGVDMLSLSGSKVVDAGKTGVLYKKEKVPLENILYGGDQEGGLRPGTENVGGAQELARSLLTSERMKAKEGKRLTALRDYFLSSLIRTNSEVKVNGDLENRLPNNVNITLPKVPSDLLVIELSARGVMASAKSACKSVEVGASHVIKAINPKASDADGSLRFCLGRGTTKKDLDYTVSALNDILKKLKKWYN